MSLHPPRAGTGRPLGGRGWPALPVRLLASLDHRVFVPAATIQNWVEAAGKKKFANLSTTYLDEVLTNFTGSLAIDEVYDGPFCVPQRG